MLYLAVERARAFEGKLLYMSATPTNEMLGWIKTGRASGYTIPARYHGFPLPEPAIVIDRNISYPRKGEKLGLPQRIIDFIIKSVEVDKAQLFVFVPTISIAGPIAEFLQQKLSHKSLVISYSFARDPERDQKRKAFSEGRTDVFVTTSIMERGITITRANVLVLFADFQKIYSWRTLVQMAGRAGRTAEYPNGEVLFAAAANTDAMLEAVQVIARMNKEAKAKGYLI
jgi:competence protein ComFA